MPTYKVIHFKLTGFNKNYSFETLDEMVCLNFSSSLVLIMRPRENSVNSITHSFPRRYVHPVSTVTKSSESDIYRQYMLYIQWFSEPGGPALLKMNTMLQAV